MIVISIFEKELKKYLNIEEVEEIINEVYEQLSKTCSFVMRTGKRIGSVCGRKCPGETYCKTHQKQVEKKYCTMILKTGKNKGKKCCKVEHLNGYCKTHIGQIEPVEELTTEPVEELTTELTTEPVEELTTEPVEELTTEPVEELTTEPVEELTTEPVEELTTEPVEELTTEPVEELTTEPVEELTTEPVEELTTEPVEELTEQELVEYNPNWDISVHNILRDLAKLPEKTIIETYGYTSPDIEELKDENDDYIDTLDLTEVYSYDRECQYWVKKQNYFCCEPVAKGSNQFCKEHLRYTGKIEFKDMLFHTQPLYEIMPSYYRILGFSGQYYYPRLLLAAKPTSEGLVVIGRLLARQWVVPLTEREIKRCHNNGLLYKVLSQDIVHYNYHIPDIERIEGSGFISYDQIRFERPKLYIKYWNIWNNQIRIRKEYIVKWSKFKGNTHKWTKDHFSPLPDWEKVKKEFKIRGLDNLIIPAPTIEQVVDKEWNPWIYCTEWVRKNQPQDIEKTYFPPYYLDYPDPYAMFCRPFEQAILKERKVDYNNPEHTKHYNYGPIYWGLKIEGKKIEYINTSFW